jgi:hypothetical protein
VRPVLIGGSCRNIYNETNEYMGGAVGFGSRKPMIPTHDVSIGGSSINEQSYNPTAIFGGINSTKNNEQSFNTLV